MFDEKMVELGAAFAAARIASGKTQLELSALTGIAQSTISKIESGICNPSLRTLHRLATAMGMDIFVHFSTTK